MQSRKSSILAVALCSVLFLELGVTQNYLQNSIHAASSGRMMPYFEVDPFWLKLLPNQWVLGSFIGVAVDARDHLYIVHRTDRANFGQREVVLALGASDCCTPLPSVLEFDPNGALVSAWGR
jgi:hypothetical protein